MPRPDRSWFDIRNATEPLAEVYIYDEIGHWGVTADQFVKAFRDIKSPAINLHVNSPGGDVFDGIAIHTAIEGHPATVNAIVDGLAASSASFLIQAADTITMAKGSALMIHEPYTSSKEKVTADDMAKSAEMLSKMADNIAGIYARRAGGTEAEWRARMREETWYRDSEAVDAHLADRVAAGQQNKVAAAVFNLLARFKHVPEWLPTDDLKARTDDVCAKCDMPATVEVLLCADCAADAMQARMPGALDGIEIPADWGWGFRESASYTSPLEQLLKEEAKQGALTAGIAGRGGT